MKTFFSLSYIATAVGVLFAGSHLLAQPADETGISDDASASFSYSSKANLDRNGKVGDVAISHFDFADNARVPLTSDLKLLAGIFWDYDDLKLSGPVPLPNRLEEVGANLGVVKELGSGWTGTFAVRPGFYGDFKHMDSKSFNLPAFLNFGYKMSPSLSLNMGLAVNTKSKDKVLPIVGVRWAFAPDWTLFAGFPRTEVTYKFSRELTLKTGVRFQGGGYRVTTAPAPGLGNTYLDYREIRGGVGVEYRLLDNLTLDLDGGAVINRRFDYYKRNFILHGSSAAYFKISANFRF
ncbi:MAG TPA: DUF6268 family outer membrane beta-barrel protein [Opitutaceae bacterium]|nr:DUF6268 family outer membrane beta-barrel protein [Opitutaceae bacterium]